jgi:hypothetical protein
VGPAVPRPPRQSTADGLFGLTRRATWIASLLALIVIVGLIVAIALAAKG